MGWRVALLVAVAISFAGIAYAAGRAGSSDVTLCAAKKGGELTLASKGKCGKGERKLTIAKQGVPGPKGDQGEPGAAANVAPEAPHIVGATNEQCAQNAGTFCGTPGCIGAWQASPSRPVSYQKDAGGFVHLRGAASFATGGICSSTTGGTAVAFYLPPGYRPTDQTREFPAVHCSGDVRPVTILTDGTVRPDPSSTCTTFDGIVFHP